MEKKQRIQDYCRQFNMGGLTANFDRILTEAESSEVSYIDYTLRLFESEAGHREMRNLERRLKAAGLPLSHDLNTYDYGFDNGLQKSRLSQLRELSWLDQIYNIIFMGPSGTGKTFLAAGLCFDAVQKGYKAYFRTMEQISRTLKMKDFTRSAMADYKRLLRAQLIVIDDIMLFPIQKEYAVNFFNFINQLFEKTAFIVTTNKSPKEWAKMLDDEVLATALLDRLLYRCEVINLDGKSYRMKNRKTIFNEK
ncbi:MAG: IS21-like element helper ATPase IstB [Thermodesulfovibrionia bacterium]|nr:IS21-like element helper ATPase IstB [Thermodesulfovibrionia bacterium]